MRMSLQTITMHYDLAKWLHQADNLRTSTSSKYV